MMRMRRKKMNPTKPKRWRPRFSLRTLVILVTLVCCYAACWGPTKTRGVDDVMEPKYQLVEIYYGAKNPTDRQVDSYYEFVNASAIMPLVVGVGRPEYERRYYFWFFGYVAKLPYEREIPR